MNVQEVGYESDVTVYQDDHESDFDIVIDEKSDTDDSNLARYHCFWRYFWKLLKTIYVVAID